MWSVKYDTLEHADSAISGGGRRGRGAEVTSVNMHRLGESFVEKVSDVRRRVTVDGKAAAPGELL